MSFDRTRALRLAQETFDIEAAAVQGLKARTGESFADAVAAMLTLRGRVVVMGMGKSGHVGRKIAATLASTGTPAMFVHPAEASHGDLGMIKAIDLVLAISNGGESDEITGKRPISSGIIPNSRMSSVCTSGRISARSCSFLSPQTEPKPIVLRPSRLRMMSSTPLNVPPQMNRMFVVSIWMYCCSGCLRPPCGGTLAVVPSSIFSKAC